MPARITLEVANGPLAGQQFVYEDRTTCIMGRAADCDPRLLSKPEEPNAPENRKISRHHCLLDINPPDVRIRDFGSLNGTYVNGQKIGQRQKHEQPGGKFPEHDLKDGDEFRLGNLKFRVSIDLPVVCSQCGAEIPEDEPNAAGGRAMAGRCQNCQKQTRQILIPAASPPAVAETCQALRKVRP